VARRQRKPVVGKPPVVNDPASAKLFINRELSWLGFNERVLEEAHDPTVPLVERLKFVAIVSSNLDEFFMVRVAGLKQQLSGNVAETPPDGLTAAEQLAAISTRAHAMVANLYGAWRNDIEPGLAQAGIRRVAPGELTPDQKAHLSAYFAREVWPVLTPLAVDPGHPFPMLRNRSLNLAVFMHRDKDKTGRRETVVAVVQVPSVLPRITEVPLSPASSATAEGNGVPAPGTTRFAYMLLEDLITMHAGELFPGFRVLGCSPFRVTRNFDLSIDEDEADDLLKTIQKELRRRERGSAVRLEISHDTAVEVVVFLRSALRLETDDVYLFEGPLHLADLAPLGARDDMREYRDEPFSPQIVPPLQEYDDIFRVIAQRDILLQHPYESFEDVVEFISEAADDPNVLAIKQTLYRTSADSPIVRALIRAAENGKQVTAVVELKARFDEAPNIQWARTLEDSGVHVVYGLMGLKTHCKVALVVRREGNRIKRYVHLSTGNYNPATARIYGDLSYFSARDGYADDAGALFNLLTGYSSPPSW
jgi:polyphosphate kinase